MLQQMIAYIAFCNKKRPGFSPCPKKAKEIKKLKNTPDPLRGCCGRGFPL
jgi:hypothetical protein